MIIKKDFKLKFYRLFLMLDTILCFSPVYARETDDQLVRVSSYEHEVRGLKAYSFVYENLAVEGRTASFAVGLDSRGRNLEFEHDCGGDGYPVELISPPGWSAEIFTTEESTKCHIVWNPDNRVDELKTGQAKTGFTVLLKQESKVLGPSGLGHWTVFAYKYGALTGKMGGGILEPADVPDTTPPRITVKPSIPAIWPADNNMTYIKMQVTAFDLKDPAPAVKLMSIDCNGCEVAENVQRADVGTDDRSLRVRASLNGQNKEDRVYTFVYEATDASGNSAQASATVTVKHNR